MFKPIILILAAASCGASDTNVNWGHDQRFDAIIAEFEDTTNTVIDFPVIRGELPAGKAGACYHGHQVVISPNVQSDEALWVVLWHELAHCALDLKHYDTELDIMNSNLTRTINYVKLNGGWGKAKLLERIGAAL